MTTVSAVIPVYNGARYVGQAISSVLAQTRPPVECLVIDDGSTDATAEVVGGFSDEVTYVRVDRGGVSRARNHGVQHARGELVAFLDHDDVWLPTKLERQVEALRARPDASMALGAMEVFDERKTTLAVQRLSESPPEIAVTRMVMFDGLAIPGVNSNALVRRDWLMADGGYDPSLSTCADWDLLYRSLLHGGVAYVDEPLVRYRVHDSNMSHDIASIERDMVYAFAKVFADPRLPAAVHSQRRRAYGRMYRMLAGSYRDVGERKAMLRSVGRALATTLSWLSHHRRGCVGAREVQQVPCSKLEDETELTGRQGSFAYRFEPVHACVMCRGRRFRVLGRRLNAHQGMRPRHGAAIATTINRCRDCGLIFSNPRPVPASVGHHYDPVAGGLLGTSLFPWQRGTVPWRSPLVSLFLERPWQAAGAGCRRWHRQDDGHA